MLSPSSSFQLDANLLAGCARQCCLFQKWPPRLRRAAAASLTLMMISSGHACWRARGCWPRGYERWASDARLISCLMARWLYGDPHHSWWRAVILRQQQLQYSIVAVWLGKPACSVVVLLAASPRSQPEVLAVCGTVRRCVLDHTSPPQMADKLDDNNYHDYSLLS